MRILPSSRIERCTDAHAFYALYTLDKLLQDDIRRISRKRLSDELDIAERTARSLVGILESNGLVDVVQAGIALTNYGKDMLNGLGIRLVETTDTPYVIGRSTSGAILHYTGKPLFKGVEQRNLALGKGADGCTTWTMRDGRLFMLPDWPVDDEDPSYATKLRQTSGLSDGEYLFIVGAKTEHQAKLIAIEVALDALDLSSTGADTDADMKEGAEDSRMPLEPPRSQSSN